MTGATGERMRQNIVVSSIIIQNTGEMNLLLLSRIVMFSFNIHCELYLYLHTTAEVVAYREWSLQVET